MGTDMLIMSTPTSIPATTSSTAMATAILMRVNTITSITTATNTTPNHIITATSTENITGIMSMSTPASRRRFVSICSKQLSIRTRVYP